MLTMNSRFFLFRGIISILLEFIPLDFMLTLLRYQIYTQGMPVPTNLPTDFVGELGKYFQGDIVLTPETRAVINSTKGLEQKWPDGKLYYQFSNDFSSYGRRSVLNRCMPMISDATCIEFIEGKSPDGSFVEFVQSEPSSCSSEVGKRGGRQEINIPDHCFSHIGTCAHEILHALGFWHEQHRLDRDKYILLHKNDIRPDRLDQYDLTGLFSGMDSFGSFYDYGSIMHYPPDAFALPGKTAFEPIQLFMTPWLKLEDIGQRKALSYEDVYQLQRLYNCCGVAWNYNSTAISNEDSFGRSVSLTLTLGKSPALSIKSASAKIKKTYAKFSLIFAHSICKFHLKFVKTNKAQGRMEKYLIENDGTLREDTSVIWSKCSFQDTSCQPFLLKSEDKTKMQVRQKNFKDDPGEFGDHFQGDLLNDPREFPKPFILDPVEWLWPSKLIYYVFAENVELKDKTKILKAMSEIELKTCIEFRKTLLADIFHSYVLITTSEPGCYATFGYNISLLVHRLNLNSAGCLSRGIGVAVHELLHVVGLQHEHTKPTRDHWLTINLDNVKSDKRGDMETIDLEDFWSSAGPLDYGSIMMVPKDFQAERPNLVTIEPKENIGNIVMGQREQMTAEDISKVLHLYECCTKSPKTRGELLSKKFSPRVN